MKDEGVSAVVSSPFILPPSSCTNPRPLIKSRYGE